MCIFVVFYILECKAQKVLRRYLLASIRSDLFVELKVCERQLYSFSDLLLLNVHTTNVSIHHIWLLILEKSKKQKFSFIFREKPHLITKIYFKCTKARHSNKTYNNARLDIVAAICLWRVTHWLKLYFSLSNLNILGQILRLRSNQSADCDFTMAASKLLNNSEINTHLFRLAFNSTFASGFIFFQALYCIA